MRILYPYNEILPKKKAHDVYIVNQCQAFANAKDEVILLCGKGSVPNKELCTHYGLKGAPFDILPLPICRKNNWLNLSWNRIFFHFSQKKIEELAPDIVFLSVLKQGEYQLERKVKKTVYVYEVHELAYYPSESGNYKKFLREKEVLQKADLITVTTDQLAKILKEPPYSLNVPIYVLPLAVNVVPLPPPPPLYTPLTIGYVGQLYQGQGIDFLLNALSMTTGIELLIIGGNKEEIEFFEKKAITLGLKQKVTFLGFQLPSHIPNLLQKMHAFVAPFKCEGKMAYVAHTKLHEYSTWGRPIIVPNLPVVKEHFTSGVVYFEPNHLDSLIFALNQMKDKSYLNLLQNEIKKIPSFSWERRIIKYKKILQY